MCVRRARSRAAPGSFENSRRRASATGRVADSVAARERIGDGVGQLLVHLFGAGAELRPSERDESSARLTGQFPLPLSRRRCGEGSAAHGDRFGHLVIEIERFRPGFLRDRCARSAKDAVGRRIDDGVDVAHVGAVGISLAVEVILVVLGLGRVAGSDDSKPNLICARFGRGYRRDPRDDRREEAHAGRRRDQARDARPRRLSVCVSHHSVPRSPARPGAAAALLRALRSS